MVKDQNHSTRRNILQELLCRQLPRLVLIHGGERCQIRHIRHFRIEPDHGNPGVSGLLKPADDRISVQRLQKDTVHLLLRQLVKLGCLLRAVSSGVHRDDRHTAPGCEPVRQRLQLRAVIGIRRVRQRESHCHALSAARIRGSTDRRRSGNQRRGGCSGRRSPNHPSHILPPRKGTVFIHFFLFYPLPLLSAKNSVFPFPAS